MQVVFISHEDVPHLPETVVAAGYFDGFHIGHQALVEKARQEGKRLGIAWGILTFDPDPWTIFHPDRDLSHLMTLEERMEAARLAGADVFYVLRFTREFAALSPDTFHQLLERMHVVLLVCGFDFRYGFKNQGDVHSLASSPISVSVVDCVAELGEKVSSTRIEEELAKGDTLEAGKMLGHWHSIPGIVAAGFQRGSKLLNFPTANLEAEPGHVLPAGGVYAGEVLVDGKWHPAMINIGSNPTFGNKKASVEAHILNYSGDLYGKRVRFAFGPRLRDEQKFPDFQALKAQLEKDVKRTPLVLEEQKDLCAASHKFWSF